MAFNHAKDGSRDDAGARIADYCAVAGRGDVVGGAKGAPAFAAWTAAIDEALRAGNGNLEAARERVQRRADDIGSGFRLAGEKEERRWPVSPLPLLIHEAEWQHIAAGVAQRARLMETIIADIYGQQRLLSGGVIPPSLVTGSAQFLHQMIGIKPLGGKYMRLFAADLARGPDGEWRALADHAQAPIGMGYALENRLAVARTLTGLQARLNVERLAPFFAAWRGGLASVCNRQDPRLALLTAGRFNQSYAEQAHLSRYMGLVLVEGADLAVHDDNVYLRTIEGLKRIDGLWQKIAAPLLDPLSLDSTSRIGVPGLIDAVAAGNTALANMPGCAVVESPAFAAFLPRLSVLLTGEALKLPSIATWWCGQSAEAAHVMANLDDMVVAPAFNALPLGLSRPEGQLVNAMTNAQRTALVADMARRPMDYVGQEVVRVSTMPALHNGHGDVVPRPFTLRVFAAVDNAGHWTVMPGGFVRIGDMADIRAAAMGPNSRSADVIIYADRPVAPTSLIADAEANAIRRNPGTLPSRVAENLFWLGRYLERGESVLALVRASQGGGFELEQGAALSPDTIGRLYHQLANYGAIMCAQNPSKTLFDLAQAALDDAGEVSSVRSLLISARGIGDGSRERLSADFWTLLDAPFPSDGGFLYRVGRLQERFSALAGQASEHMGRTAGWRFHDLGRRIERAAATCRIIRSFGADGALDDDLALLLDLSNMRISYRQRYPTGLSLARVRDLVGLDPYNPRSVAFQLVMINEHLGALPRLRDDGMAEQHEAAALALQARVAILEAGTLNAAALLGVEDDLLALSDAIGARFFLRGSAPLRASGMTFA
jgi:uncharacterized circularly permuted ATP-grasp superfamily protein/uncharacterized alpha-E superfamily protein